MAPIVPILGLLAGGVGTAATVGVGLSTALSLGSTVLGGIASIKAGQFQSAVLRRQSASEKLNAERVVYSGQINQQEQDAAANAQMGQETAQQAASGFSLNSSSFAQRANLLRVLTRRDSLRIRNDADIQAQGLNANAATLAANAQQAKPGFMDYLQIGLGVGSDLITGATMINRNQANLVRRDSVGVH